MPGRQKPLRGETIACIQKGSTDFRKLFYKFAGIQKDSSWKRTKPGEAEIFNIVAILQYKPMLKHDVRFINNNN